jgi:hypothetical protein
MLHRAKETPKPAGVVMHPRRADLRKDHRARMDLTNPDRQSAVLASLVPKPEAVTTPALALVLRKSHSAALAHAGLGVAVGGKCPTEVHRSLLEHLSRYRMPPCQACDLVGDGTVRRSHEYSPGGLAALPSVEPVDQVEPRPRHRKLSVHSLRLEGVKNQPEALVVGKPRSPSVPG